jgi:hypothetical protein
LREMPDLMIGQNAGQHAQIFYGGFTDFFF